MSWRAFGVVVSVAAAAAFALGAACNSGAGACPSADSVQPGASCDDEHLQCAYTLATPSAACDGTSTTIASSCTCTHGSWACPDPIACDAGDEAGDHEGGTDDGGGGEGAAP